MQKVKKARRCQDCVFTPNVDSKCNHKPLTKSEFLRKVRQSEGSHTSFADRLRKRGLEDLREPDRLSVGIDFHEEEDFFD